MTYQLKFFVKKSFLLFFVFTTFLFSACKKQSPGILLVDEIIENKFFCLSSINDTDITNFAIEIKKRNSKEKLLQKFIDYNGFILWNYAQKIKSSKGILAILPFAIENKHEINGFIIARQDPRDNTITFDVFNKKLLAQYGFNEDSKKI